MTGAELARGYHNALAAVTDGYGRVLEVVSTENAALRMKVAALEAELASAKRQGTAMNPGDVGD